MWSPNYPLRSFHERHDSARRDTPVSIPSYGDVPLPENWFQRPDPGKRVYYELVRARLGAIMHFVILGNELWGVNQHYDGANTHPCIGRERRCRGCLEGLDVRWYGYLAVMSQTTRRKHILQLTKGAYERCPALDQQAGQLRGYSCTLSRRGENRNAPAVFQLGARIPNPQQLPPPFNVPEALLQIWFPARRGTVPPDQLA